MTAQVPDEPRAEPPTSGPPPQYGAPAAARPPVTHPPAPTPPRSRAGAHVLALFSGLVLTPFAIVCLAGGARAIATALADRQDPSVAALGAVVAAAGLLGIVGATTAASAVGAIAGGAVYGVAPGIGFLVWPDTFVSATSSAFEPVESVGGDHVLEGTLTLGRSAALLLLGLTLVLVGIAASVARRAGRTYEREEAAAAAAAADRISPYARPSDPVPPPVPPRNRRLDHLVTLAIGILLTPVAIVLFAAGSAEVADAAGRGEPVTATLLLGSGALGAGLLVAAVLASGWSSFGLLAAGLVYGVVPGALGLFFPEWTDRGVGGFLAQLGESLDPLSAAGLEDLTVRGVLLTWGALAVLGAVGIHFARRDARRRERAELAVRQAMARPAL